MSQIKEEFARSLYKSIGFLNQDKDIQLVQHQIDGKIYVMKSQKQSYREIYHLLLKHSHKNIVRFMEVLNGEENLLIIEEYVTGDTIDEFLGKKEKISDKTIRSVFLQILAGVSHLHSIEPKIIHRDMKPSNVIVNSDGIVKIIDFNSSRFYKEGTNGDTQLLGTEGYAAPEQYGFAQTDERTDVYALGVLLNYLVTGIHPKEKIDPGKYNRLIKKATALSPEDRFQNVFELKKEFVKINKKHEASAIRLIPGFRSKTAWKMITAGLFYFMLVAMAFSSVGESANTVVGLIDGILFLGFVFSVIALFFYGRRRFQLPLLTHDNFFVCIFGYLAYILLLIIVYGLLLDVLQIFI